MKEFDLEKALAGEPVKLRNGLKAYVLKKAGKEVKNAGELFGCIVDDNEMRAGNWNADGTSNYSHTPSPFQIVGMWEEPKRYINGIEVPEPVREETWVDGACYWYVDLGFLSEVSRGHFYEGHRMDKKLVSNGMVFETEQGAKAMAKALLNFKEEYKQGD